MYTQEQIFLASLFTTIVVALVVIPFFSRLFIAYSDYKQGKEESVSTGIAWAIVTHIFIIVILIAVIKMWDLIIGSSLPDYVLQGTGGLFDIFWSDANSFNSTSEIINSLNAYRAMFHNMFEFVLSMLIGLSPFIFFSLAFFVTSPNKRQAQQKTSDIVSRIIRAGLYTFVTLVFLIVYLNTMDAVIFYKGGATTVFDMSQAYWKKLFTTLI